MKPTACSPCSLGEEERAPSLYEGKEARAEASGLIQPEEEGRRKAHPGALFKQPPVKKGKMLHTGGRPSVTWFLPREGGEIHGLDAPFAPLFYEKKTTVSDGLKGGGGGDINSWSQRDCLFLRTQGEGQGKKGGEKTQADDSSGGKKGKGIHRIPLSRSKEKRKTLSVDLTHVQKRGGLNSPPLKKRRSAYLRGGEGSAQ